MSERQKLVHLLTSGTTAPNPLLLNLGEIAVQHASEESCLYIKNQDGDLIKFIESGTIQTMVDNVSIDCGFYYSGVTHEYVDLGLPSGTLWATENIKNSNGDDLYFAWGEISGYTASQVGVDKNFSWGYDLNSPNDYIFGPYDSEDEVNNGMTKYNNSDNKRTLDPEDDAATVNWGSDWRMPTKDQWNELFNNTTSAWTQVEGIYGAMFTSTSNSNTLFIPSFGKSSDGNIYFSGIVGSYWCNNAISRKQGYGFSCEDGYCGTSAHNRFEGYAVRPVRKTN